MNRILLFPENKVSSGHFQITDSAVIEHLLSVIKIKQGDVIKACELNVGLGEATVKEVSEKLVQLEYHQTGPGVPAKVDLLIGLSRPPTCKKVLEHGTSMGVHGFNFFKAELSEKSYMDSKLFQNKKYRELMHLGLSQSAIYTHEPKFNLSNRLPNLGHFENHQKFILSLKAEKTFSELKVKPTSPILLAIGPERGWTEHEEDCFEQMGFTPVSISRSTLRVEQATFSALAQIEMIALNSN